MREQNNSNVQRDQSYFFLYDELLCNYLYSRCVIGPLICNQNDKLCRNDNPILQCRQVCCYCYSCCYVPRCYKHIDEPLDEGRLICLWIILAGNLQVYHVYLTSFTIQDTGLYSALFEILCFLSQNKLRGFIPGIALSWRNPKLAIISADLC